MLAYVIKRILLMIPTLIAVSMVTFLLIQLPPGDFVTTLAAEMSQMGDTIDPTTLAMLREQYGLDEPIWKQYWIWISNILFHGDFGRSFDWNVPVSDLIWDRLGLTLILSLTTLIFTWVVSLPIGIYSAVKKYSVGDYAATFFAFVGLAIPNFLLALILMYLSYRFLGISIDGLFSPEYANAPWSWGRVLDLAQHLIVPVIVLGTAGTAALVRIMRANLLDELYKPYVTTARAKGLSEWRHPLPGALGPQPIRLHHRLGSAGTGVRGDGDRHCAQPPDHRPAVVEGPDRAGRLSGRGDDPDAVDADRHRHADFRSTTRLARPPGQVPIGTTPWSSYPQTLRPPSPPTNRATPTTACWAWSAPVRGAWPGGNSKSTGSRWPAGAWCS